MWGEREEGRLITEGGEGEEKRGDCGREVTVLPTKEQSLLLVEIPFLFSLQAKQLKNSVGQ